MKTRTIYLETSVIGYATAREVKDPLVAARFEWTRQWLRQAEASPGWQFFVSEPVLVEISRGDPTAAQERVELVKGYVRLDTSDAAESLAERLVTALVLPSKARMDALHIATAAYHGIEFLVTWNCSHIANATMRPVIDRVCLQAGYEAPVICTPEELAPDATT